jgi:hypothetical protein
MAQRGGHQNVSAMAAVASGGAAAGDELLAPEGHTPIPAVPGLNPDFCLIDEHFISSLQG